MQMPFGTDAGLVIVESPPGAGKTWLVEQIVAMGVLCAGFNVCCVTPRASQGFDLLARLTANFQLPRVEGLLAVHRNALAGAVAFIVYSIRLAIHQCVYLDSHESSIGKMLGQLPRRRIPKECYQCATPGIQETRNYLLYLGIGERPDSFSHGSSSYVESVAE